MEGEALIRLLKLRCGGSNKRSLLLPPHLFSQSLTAQALFTLKIRRARTQIAIPCECLLGEGVLCTQAEMVEQYGRDALNNTFGECVVAKANEADCFANAEVQSPKGRGDVSNK